MQHRAIQDAMKKLLTFGGLTLTAFCIFSCSVDPAEKAPETFTVPVEYFKLDNGLKVVLSEDHTAPIVAVAVYYNIGFRNEPKGRTGFAHLFEHMMFEGTKNLPKGEFNKLSERNGGFVNGSTRFDFTNYYEVVPSHMLEPVLWSEADRMTALDLTQENLANQQGVVKSEVRVNVLNQPYGGFPWIDMPMRANENWYNAHNFYGDLAELDAAKLEEINDFFSTYYTPNNACLTIVGDFDIEEAKTWVKKYFTPIPPSQLPPAPDITEPKQTAEKRFTKKDSLATKPAIAVAYKMPETNSTEYFAMGLIDQLLVQGNDSKLIQKLVQEKGYTSNVSGGINYLGNMFNYNGPMVWMCDMIHDATISPDSIVAQLDQAIAELDHVSQEDLDIAIIKIRSGLYDNVGGSFGLGRADLLSCFALFYDDPARINILENEFKKITPEVIKKTASEYLRVTNRTILLVEPKSEDK